MTPVPALAPVLAGATACLLATVGLRPVRRTIPYLGGMTLVAATAGAAMAILGLPDRRVSAVLLAAAAVALLGLIADVGTLPLATRLIVESVAAGGVVLCGVQVTLTGDWLDGPVSVMWIVAMTNAYGLLDRLGGALAAVAAVTGAFLTGTALVLGDPFLAVLTAALAGVLLAALPYGRTPGRVRLGPSGSLFAGFVLTCTAAALTAGRGTAVIAAGLLLPALAAVVGASAYAVRRPWRPGQARGAAPALCGVAACAGTAGLAVALGWVPAGPAATVTAVTSAAFLSHACLARRMRRDGSRALDRRGLHAHPRRDEVARGTPVGVSGRAPSGDARERGRVPRPRSAGNPPPPHVRRG
ncbi:hypothetical protein [Microbispora sp. H11081]|uniref:hypothetical protein n=1 Tax=Microbispora sp. H11081 TaxID=2729107 RepID=UPI0014736861|nr:hypothetical protein [Microbispora sp. H11081]